MRGAAVGLGLALALVAGCGGGAAQADAGKPPQVDAGVDAQVDARPPFALDPARVYADVAWLAAPEREGRAPGTPGNAAALAYIEALFVDLGLQPAGVGGTYRQPFAYQTWGQTGPPAVGIGGVEGTYETDFIVVIQSGSGSVSAELAFVGHAMTVPPFDASAYPSCPLPATGYDDFAGLDVTGKIVVALRRGPGDVAGVNTACPANAACQGTGCLWDFGYKAANAALHGAAAVILLQDYAHDDTLVPGVTLTAAYYDPALPVVWSTRAAVEAAVPSLPTWAQEIGATKTPSSHLTGVTATVTTSTEVAGYETANLLGAVPGADAGRGRQVVLVGAHVDGLGVDGASGTVYPGADDNASGTAVMMELARAAVRGADPPARTLLFAAWNAEEDGLFGSCHYVDHPVFPLGDTVAMMSVDMVGAGSATGVDVYGGGEGVNQWLRDVLAGATADAGLPYVVATAPPATNSDHACFAAAGVSAVLVTTSGQQPDYHAYYHTPDDTPEHVSVADLEAALRVLWAGLQPLGRGAEGTYQAWASPTRLRPAPGASGFAPRSPRSRATVLR
jgi:hypothetical protein